MRWPPKNCQFGPNEAARAAAEKKADEVGLTHSTRWVYIFMGSWIDENTGMLVADIDTLRRRYRCSAASMQIILKQLREKKLLDVGRAARAYRLPPGVLPKADSEG